MIGVKSSLSKEAKILISELAEDADIKKAQHGKKTGANNRWANSKAMLRARIECLLSEALVFLGEERISMKMWDLECDRLCSEWGIWTENTTRRITRKAHKHGVAIDDRTTETTHAVR